MQLCALYPGATLEEVQAEIAWPLRAAEAVEQTAAPSAEELRLIREELDPRAMYR
jgi:glutaconate CoA-transferase subunit B